MHAQDDGGGLEQEIESLNRRLLEKELAITGREAEARERGRAIRGFQLKMENLEDENASLRIEAVEAKREMEMKEKTIRELRQKIQELTNDLIASDDEVQRVTKLYGEMEKKFGSEIRRGQDQLREARGVVEKTRLCVLELQDENESLKHAATEALVRETESDKMRCVNDGLALEVQKLRAELEAVQKENQALIEAADSMKRGHQALESQNREMLAKLEEVAFDRQEKESLLEKISVLNSTIDAIRDGNSEFEKLLDEVETLRRENSDLRKIIDKDSDNAEEDQHSLSEGEVATRILDEQCEEEEKGNDDMAQLRAENEDLREEVSMLQAENKELQAHLDNMLAVQCHSMIDQLEGVRVTNQDLRQRSFDFSALAEENALLKHRIFGLESQNQDFQRLIKTGQGGNQVVSSLMKENSEMKHELEKLHKIVDPSLKRMEHIVRGLKRMEDEKSSDDESQTNIEDVVLLTHENDTLKKIVDAFDPNMLNMELSHKLHELERSCAEAEERVRTLETSNEQMAEWLSGNRSRQDDLIERYTTENEILKATITDLQRQLESRSETDFYTETALANHRIKELEEEVKRLKTFDDDVVDNLQEQVEYLQSSVDTLTEEKEQLEKIVREQENMIHHLEGEKIRAAQIHLDSLQKDLTINQQKEQLSEMNSKIHEFQQETTIMQEKVDKVIHAFEESQEKYTRMQEQIESVQAQLNSTLEENTQLKRELAEHH